MEELNIYLAPIGPTTARLPKLRSIVCDRESLIGSALPSIFVAAPRLERLTLFLDCTLPNVLATVHSSALANLQHLALRLKPQDGRPLPSRDKVIAFVGRCSAPLHSIELGPFPPGDVLSLFGAVTAPLRAAEVHVALKPSRRPWGSVEC